MKATTKKYKLESAQYLQLAMTNVVTSWWWAFIVPIVISAMTFVIPSNWWWISAIIITVIYLLFWAIQFSGVTQLEQFKILFERLSYEIDSRQILIKLNAKQGMPITWEQVKNAKKGKDAFVVEVSKAQLIHLPFKIFNTENDIRFVESIMKRKGFLK